MIEWLSGILRKKNSTGIILDVQGVGYGLQVPLSVFCELPEVGFPCSLWVYTKVREDELRLFGFLHAEEKDVFNILLDINGIGPKVSLAILSTLSLSAIRAAVEQENVDAFGHVPGVGRRTAEKILLELKNKVNKLPVNPRKDENKSQGAEVASINGAVFSQKPLFDLSAGRVELDPWGLKPGYADDLRSALSNLGFSEKDVGLVLKKVKPDFKGESFQDLVRFGLKNLSARVESRI